MAQILRTKVVQRRIQTFLHQYINTGYKQCIDEFQHSLTSSIYWVFSQPAFVNSKFRNEVVKVL